MLFLLLLIPVVLAGVLIAIRLSVAIQYAIFVTAALAHAAIVSSFWWQPPPAILSGWLALDDLGLIFLSIVSFLFVLIAIYLHGFLRAQKHAADGKFLGAFLLFVTAMTLVTLSRQLGLLWVALELSTLTSAPLINFHKTRRSLEALWKYLLIGSVGVALALLGTMFVGIADSTVHPEAATLQIDHLIADSSNLNPAWLKIAFILLLIGFGTKMGLVPLHTWLPDAHSEAPAPVSAMLSGALLNCAFLGILRIYQICLAAGIGAFARELLLLFGLLSLGMAAGFIVVQKDFKRMLAYSSIEHIGILALGIGIGGAASYGVMLHAVNHSLTKGLLFLVAGNLVIFFHNQKIGSLRAVLQRLPATGALLIAGLIAIVGTPPFGLFMSEFTIFNAAVQTDHSVVAAVYLLFLAVAFIGMMAAMTKMLHGKYSEKNAVSVHRESGSLLFSPVILATAVLVLGLYLPQQLQTLLMRAAQLLGGGI